MNLDLCIRFGFNIITGPILTKPKHGIWSFHHGDNRVNRGGPAAFWETYLKSEYIGITLQKLNTNLDSGEIIARASYNTTYSYFLNHQIVLNNSKVILMKS